MNDAWEDVVATALVGTAKRAVPSRTDSGPDSGVHYAEDIAGQDAARLLATAAVLATRSQAGMTAIQQDGHVAEPAPSDVRPVCSATAAQIFELLLSGSVSVLSRDQLLVHWLERCAAADMRPPHEQLPALLKRATQDSYMREAASAALGERGRWLAGQIREWKWAAGLLSSADWDEIDRVWREGAPAERSSALRLARLQDQDRGRALLETTWSTEKADARAELLGLLRPQIGSADEPMLEAALDDRSKLVRPIAISLLDLVPTSRRSTRMTARLAPLVRTEGRLKPKLLIDLPDALDERAIRDGLEPYARQKAPKAWTLERIVAAVPLGWWVDHLGWDAATVVRRVDEEAVTSGLIRAAITQRESDWCAALFETTGQGALLAPIDALVAERLAVGQFRRVSATSKFPVATIENLRAPWSPALSDVVLDALAVQEFSRVSGAVRSALGQRLNLSIIPRIAMLIPDADQEQFLRHLHHTLTLRQSIDAEFRTPRQTPPPLIPSTTAGR